MGKIREEPLAQPVACNSALAIFTAACLTISPASPYEYRGSYVSRVVGRYRHDDD